MVRRLGLIGGGGIVQRVHALGYRALEGEAEVAALADVSDANRAATGALLRVSSEQRYTDYRDMLARAPIDTVVIATPHALHVEHAVAAAEAGKAIISEKPMAVTLAEADRILAAVERSRVPYAVVHNLLFSAPVLAARRLIADGTIGEVLMARGEMMGFKNEATTRGDLDWRASRQMGGGALIDSSYHEIYTVEALVGSPIARVQANVATLKFAIDVDDTALMLFEHANGRLSTVSASWCARSQPGGRWATAFGAKGAVRVVYNAPRPLSLHAGERWTEPDPAELVPNSIEGDSTGHAALLRETVRALNTGAPPPVGITAARHNLAIVEAAQQASAARRAAEVAAL